MPTRIPIESEHLQATLCELVERRTTDSARAKDNRVVVLHGLIFEGIVADSIITRSVSKEEPSLSRSRTGTVILLAAVRLASVIRMALT